MITNVHRPKDLEPKHLEAWRRIQSKYAELQRPFFSPEYYQLLGEVRSDVYVAVIEYGGDVVGLFPFQRHAGGRGHPVGLRLSDFQGLIGSPDLRLDAFRLLRACGLSTYRFNHLLAGQAAFRQFHSATSPSWFADLSQGFDAYQKERRAAGANWVSQLPRKARKLEREVGPLRFQYDCRDPEVFRQLLAWKSLQRERTQTEDVLQFDWVRHFLNRALEASAPTFAGRLSALYAGSQLVAAHFGIVCRRSLHLWFPAYDVAFEQYSPGLIMFVEMFRATAEAGLQRVDFGKGRDRYKLSMASGSVDVAEGCIDARMIGRLWTGTWYAGRNWVRNSPFHDAIQGPKRRLRGLIRWMAPGNP